MAAAETMVEKAVGPMEEMEVSMEVSMEAAETMVETAGAMEEMAAMMEVAHRLGTRLATAHSPSWH